MASFRTPIIITTMINSVVGSSGTTVNAAVGHIINLSLCVQGLRAELRTATVDKQDHQKLQLSYSQLQDSHYTLQSEHTALEESYEDLRWRFSERTVSMYKAKEEAAAQMERAEREHALQLEVICLINLWCCNWFHWVVILCTHECCAFLISEQSHHLDSNFSAPCMMLSAMLV